MLRKSLVLMGLLPPIFFCATLHSQTQAEITGEVTDASGAVLPGATITVKNVATNATRQMRTNAAGVYDFPSLSPGLYSLTATASGFQTMVRSGIELQVQQVVRSDFHMQLGQVTQTVTVSTAAPLLDTEDATVGTVIGTNRIQDLPLNGRDFLQLVSLSPNVVYGFAPAGQQVSIQGGQRAATTISIAGQRSEWNYYTLDGIDNTDDNFNDYLLLPSIDALQEFKVQYGIYPAEYGRNVGQVNISTRSGTNAYHGALWDFVRNSLMDAFNYDFTNAPGLKSPLNRNQFGYTLGGPLSIPRVFNGKNRLFFMTNYEGQRWYTSLQKLATVPTLAQRGQAPGDPNADFSAPGLNPIYDPATRQMVNGVLTAQQFPGNVIPANRFDPNALKILQYYPAPNVAGQIGPTGAPIDNYQVLNSQVQNSDQFTARIDLNESAKSTWFGRYSWSSEYNLTPGTFPNQGSILSTIVHQPEIGNTRVITPNIVNQLLFGYSGFQNVLVTQGAFGPNIEGGLGITGLAVPIPLTYGIPSMGPTGYTGWGDPDTAPDLSHDHIFQVVDNVSMTRGKHTFQFGAEIQRDEYNQEGNQQTDGSFGFSGFATENPQASSTTGDGFADYMLGLVNGSSGPVVPLAVAQLRATDQYYYFEDTWKIRPNLTISPGLRYAIEPPWWSKHDEMINTQINSIPQTVAGFATYDPANPPVVVRQGTANNFFAGLPWVFAPGISFAQDGRLGKYLVNPDHTMFAPRLGLAYTPSAKWTLRSGFGIFNAMLPGNTIYDMSRNRAVRRQVTANTNAPNLTLENPFGLPPGGNALIVASPTILSNWVQRSSPYVIQYLLNVQRQLSPNTALEIGYLGSQSHHLSRFANLNVPLPGPGSPQTRRPDPNLAAIQEVEPYANANYNSLEVKYTQQMSHGLNALVGYTYSRSIDDGSAIRSHGGDSDFAQNPYNKGRAGGERGPSNFNQPHRLVTSLLYEPPLGRGKPFLNHGFLSEALGNWQFNEIFTLASGLPYTFGETGNVLNGGGGSSSGGGARPNYSGQPLAPTGGQNRFQWFNIGAYAFQPQYTFGDVSRNSAYGPGSLEWDSSVMKMFPVWREQDLQFRFEAFNVINHPNFGLPSATLGSSTFGTIDTTALPMRELQLSLKYLF